MSRKWKIFAKLFFGLSCVFFFCEYLNYYVVISQCSWPKLEHDNNEDTNKSIIKAMFLADTHLLGPYRGHWFDKLRREWQMYRAFQSAISLYHPEVVFILGDLFDEGQWCDDAQLLDYFTRFSYLFEVPNGTKMHIVPGNHDIGFHYAIHPYLLNQFEKLFNITSVQFLHIKGNYFVLINSMAMEGDNCFLCSGAERKIKNIAAKLNCVKNKANCSKEVKIKEYSHPIVLQHFPMYRKSDSLCNERDEAPPELKNILFREKWDCLSKKASEMIYDELDPRLIITGHVHHGCHLVHRQKIHEYTLPSFSWRNKNNPTFILAKISPRNFAVQKCDLPKETTVISIYACVVLSVVILFVCFTKNQRNSRNQRSNLECKMFHLCLLNSEY